MQTFRAISPSPFQAVTEAEAARAKAIQRQKFLRNINTGLGQGGIIHGVKNALLRGDDKYINRGNEISVSLNKLLHDYGNIANVSTRERQSLAIISDTVAWSKL